MLCSLVLSQLSKVKSPATALIIILLPFSLHPRSRVSVFDGQIFRRSSCLCRLRLLQCQKYYRGRWRLLWAIDKSPTLTHAITSSSTLFLCLSISLPRSLCLSCPTLFKLYYIQKNSSRNRFFFLLKKTKTMFLDDFFIKSQCRKQHCSAYNSKALRPHTLFSRTFDYFLATPEAALPVGTNLFSAVFL